MESCCSILPRSLLYSAPQPLLVGLNPAPATTAILSLQRLFSNFSLQSEKKKALAVLWMDGFEFEHVTTRVVKTDLEVLISEDILALRQFLPHEIFCLLHL